MIVVAYSWSNNLDKGIDMQIFLTEKKGIQYLIKLLRDFSDNSELTSILKQANKALSKEDYDTAYEMLNNWCFEYQYDFMFSVKNVSVKIDATRNLAQF